MLFKTVNGPSSEAPGVVQLGSSVVEVKEEARTLF